VKKSSGILLIISFLLIGVLLLWKNARELPLFSDDFLIGLAFWILGWWLTFTSSGVSVSQRIWRLGGLWSHLVYRGMDRDERNAKIAEGSRFSGVLFIIFGWLLMTVELWRGR